MPTKHMSFVPDCIHHWTPGHGSHPGSKHRLALVPSGAHEGPVVAAQHPDAGWMSNAASVVQHCRSLMTMLTSLMLSGDGFPPPGHPPSLRPPSW